VPTLQQAQQLQEFALEVFELSKNVWAAQSRAKARDGAELSETEFLALDLLVRAEHPLSVGEIQRQIGILPAQMSRVVRALESKSEAPLISCRINQEDKRKIDVELTPAGVAAHRAYRQAKLGSIEKILLSLDNADREEFMRILRIIHSTMHNAMSDRKL
jgi:DNA-binding MarR family transcriptional regulator